MELSKINEATFTKRLGTHKHPYVLIVVPADVARLLELKVGDYVEIHLKVVKRV